jgi:hypothetical protein
MNVSINKKAGTITITLPLAPAPSASGKSLTLASTRGNKTSEVEYEGKQVVIGVNAYVPA